CLWVWHRHPQKPTHVDDARGDRWRESSSALDRGTSGLIGRWYARRRGNHVASDNWTLEGRRVTDPAIVDALASIMEGESDLIVEHRFYRGSRAPFRFVCSSADDLRAYLSDKVRCGDALVFWKFEACCSDEYAKVPDAEGRTPVGGAY